MQWFYDLKTIHKMTILIAVMAISIIIVGFTGYHFAQKNADSIQSLYKDRAMPLEQLNTIISNTNRVKADLYDLLLTSDNARNKILYDDIMATRAQNNKLMKDYEATKLDPYEVDNLKKYKEALKAYRSIQTKVIDLGMANRNIEGYKYFLANEQKLTALQKVVKDLAGYNSKVAKDLAVKGEKDASFGTMVVIITIIIALILCTWLGFITATRIAGILANLAIR